MYVCTYIFLFTHQLARFFQPTYNTQVYIYMYHTYLRVKLQNARTFPLFRQSGMECQDYSCLACQRSTWHEHSQESNKRIGQPLALQIKTSLIVAHLTVSKAVRFLSSLRFEKRQSHGSPSSGRRRSIDLPGGKPSSSDAAANTFPFRYFFFMNFHLFCPYSFRQWEFNVPIESAI